MRTTRAVTVVLAVIALGALVVRWIGDSASTDPARIVASDFPFTTSKVSWSPDGTMLAAVTNGELQLYRVADRALVMSVGDDVVNAAWMPDGRRVLVTEGPIPTGEVSVVDLAGAAVGVAKLAPSLDFDTGSGLDVNSSGTLAVAAVANRVPLGGATRWDLAFIDLQVGTVRIVVTPDVDEIRPFFADDASVVFAARASTLRIGRYDLGADAFRSLGDIAFGPLGMTRDGEALVGESTGEPGETRLVRLDSSSGVRVALKPAFPAGHRPVAIDPLLRRVLVLADPGTGVEVAVVKNLE